MSEFVIMITSLFLFFVAFGIVIGSMVVGFGSIGAVFAGLGAISAFALFVAYIVILLSRRTTS